MRKISSKLKGPILLMVIRKAFSMSCNFSWHLWKRPWSKLKISSKTAKDNSMINNLKRKMRSKNRKVTSSRRWPTTRRKCKIWSEKQMKGNTLSEKMKGNAIQFKESGISLNQKSSNSMKRNNNNSRSSTIILMKKIIRKHSRTYFHRIKRAK